MGSTEAHLDGKEIQMGLQLAADMMVMVLSLQDQGKVPHLVPTCFLDEDGTHQAVSRQR